MPNFCNHFQREQLHIWNVLESFIVNDIFVGCGEECVTPVLVRSLKLSPPQPVTGSVSRLVFTGSIPVLPTNLWFQKHLRSTSGQAVMPPCRMKGQRGGCQQLSQRKGACFLFNKKEASSGLIQVNDDEKRNGGQAGRVYGCQL